MADATSFALNLHRAKDPLIMLHINDLTYRIGGRVLLEGATAVIPRGHRVGLVGRNGSGKTTLFNLIAGDLSVDGGDIRLRAQARLGRVSQEAPAGEHSLLEEVLAADLERASLMDEAETATDPHRIAEIHIRLADIDAHSAEARAATILNGLGFDAEAQQKPLNDFSGGWRMRVALAATLFTEPDFLLLDEPTNHLDLEAGLWLESYLASYPGTILVISHERSLLNKSVNEILHIDQGKLVRYTGGYDRFERTRREKMELQSKMVAKQMEQRRHIQSFVDRFRSKATKARQAQSRLKMLERMEPIASMAEEKTTSFSFPKPTPLSPPLITLDEASVGYEVGKPILSNLSLYVDMEDRIGLLGANGNGKSTLVKLLADKLKVMEGKLRKSSKLKVAYFAQHQTDELVLDATPVEHMAKLMPMSVEPKIRAHLGRFGFTGDKATTKVENLSGGEKARLLFALMSREEPHVMLLDEPTNHLDVDAREALVQAMNAYEGAVILVSHDSHLIELTCDRLLLVEDGCCETFDGDMEDYKRLLLDKRRGSASGGKNKDSGKASKKKESRKDRAAQRAQRAPLKKAEQKAEKAIEVITKKIAAIQEKLADPTLYEGPAEKLNDLQKQLGEAEKQLAAAEETWMEAHEAHEAAKAEA